MCKSILRCARCLFAHVRDLIVPVKDVFVPTRDVFVTDTDILLEYFAPVRYVLACAL